MQLIVMENIHVNRIAFSTVQASVLKSPSDRYFVTRGMRSETKEEIKANGKKRSGIVIPRITPNAARESALLPPNSSKHRGIKTLSPVCRSVVTYEPNASGIINEIIERYVKELL